MIALAGVMPDSNRETKDPNLLRWGNLLVALAMLYVGIHGMLLERASRAGSARPLAILGNAILIAVGVGLLVVAWSGRPLNAMKTRIGQLWVHAACAGVGGWVFGLSFVLTFKRFSGLSLAVALLFGVTLVADLLWTRREVRRIASNEFSRKHATQFLWSCVFFSMICLMLGMAISGFVWLSTGFVQRFGLAFYSVMTGIAIYPVHRDAKRLADATAPRSG